MGSSPREVTLSPPLPRERLSETSRRSCAMSPLTSSRRCPPLLPPPPSRSPMSFPTVRSSPSVTRDSVAPRLCSSLPSLEWRPAASTRPPSTPPLRSRSSLPPRGSTLYGSVAPSLPPCPPSSRCGSPSRSTTSAAHPLFTASASKHLDHCLYIHTDLYQLFLIQILFSTCYLLM